MKEKISAIVLAAGKGSRMKSDIQKQFMLLGEYPVVYYSLAAFEHSPVDEIVLVTGEDDIEFCRQEIVEHYGFHKVAAIVAGGRERYESVYRGLCSLKDCSYVIIHDGARPFITQKMITDSLAEVKRSGACTVGMPVKDTIKIVDEEQKSVATPDRNTLWQIQTPQTFEYGSLKRAYETMMQSENVSCHSIRRKLPEAGSVGVTDDTMIIEQYENKSVKVLEGGYFNIKITTPEDLEIAELFLGKVVDMKLEE